MVVGIRELITLIRNAGVEDKVYSVVDEPLNVPMSKLGRIAL